LTPGNETPTFVYLILGGIFVLMPAGGWLLKTMILRAMSEGRDRTGAEQPSSQREGSRQVPGGAAGAGIPEEPLRTATTVSGDRSHRLSEGRRGIGLIPSRQRLYAGIALFCVYLLGAILMPSSVWEYLDEQSKAAKYALMVPFAASFGGLIIAYVVSRKFGTRVEFDEANRKVHIVKRRTRDTRRRADLAAIQVCYALHGVSTSPHLGYQLNLVFRSDGGYCRVCVMNCSSKKSVWGIAQALSDRLGVRLLDCATREHRKAERERFDSQVT